MSIQTRNALSLVAAIALGACAGAPAPSPAPARATAARVIGYFFGPTVNRGFSASTIQGDQLTHINYAFGQILPDGTATLANPSIDTLNFKALRELKQRYPHLKVLISFGGWGGSKYFSDAAATAESRARFIESTLVQFLRPYPGVFDGVDLDWEYPTGGGIPGNVARPEDSETLTALVSEFRRALDAEAAQPAGRYLITAATPAGPAQLRKYEMAKLAELMDFINVMTYDYHTGGTLAHFNAPLASGPDDPSPNLNIKTTVAAYLAAGVPANKLVIGVPFYGYGYAPVGAKDHGRFQPIERDSTRDTTTAAPRPKWVGAVRFYQIRDVLNDGFTRYFDDVARVPWLYNPTTRVWVTYDDAESIGEKAAYVRENGLGGVMFWELSGDDGSLLARIAERLR